MRGRSAHEGAAGRLRAPDWGSETDPAPHGAPHRMAPPHEAVEPAGRPRIAAFACDDAIAAGGGSITLPALELDLGNAMDFPFPARERRNVAARVAFGGGGRLVGEGV